MKKIGLAKSLRRRMTPAERRLWARLRAKRFHGLGFLRQTPVGPYILDFYSPVARIAVEADGYGHGGQKDRERDRFLEELGVRVLRFRNDAILYDLDRVLHEIHEECAGSIGLVDQ